MLGSSQPPVGRECAVAYPSTAGTRSPAASLPMGQDLHRWEDLRKQARKLEGDLDIKLAAYGKLCSGYDGTFGGESGLASHQAAQAKAAELEALLASLSDVNDSMSSTIAGASDARTHTLKRHRDILQEYTQEFRRLSSAFGAARDRADLFTGSSDAAPLMGTLGGTGLLLRERGILHGANTALDDAFGQAQSVAGSLGEQRRLFDNVGNKLSHIVARYPAVNGLLTAIRRKKSKDTLILSAVIAGCTLFIIIYWLNK
ncbi:hypothetical protein WJX72_005378 [[Myrmecia] bisecta]|uniref:Golgi SNAP receptor complex member 1 n=1 Tax=[Myrmecia] bisecta TaxID=41462 RepID=A0AAW1Q7R9_9CHLO